MPKSKNLTREDKLKKKCDEYHQRLKDGLCNNCLKVREREDLSICNACREEYKTSREYFKQNNICVYCRREPLATKTRCQKCREKHYKQGAIKRKEIKTLVFNHYGNKCNCCGESNLGFLQVDHINNDGYLERQDPKIKSNFYESIVKRNFPDHYQLLCANCNYGKSKFGICPHKLEESELCE